MSSDFPDKQLWGSEGPPKFFSLLYAPITYLPTKALCCLEVFEFENSWTPEVKVFWGEMFM